MTNIIKHLRNLTQQQQNGLSNKTSTYNNHHQSDHMDINIKLDLSPHLQILTEKIVYIIPFCFIILLLILYTSFRICRSRVRGCCDDDYNDDDKNINESFY